MNIGMKPGIPDNAVATDSPDRLLQEKVLYQATYDILPFKAPSRRYIMLSSQRTGSTYLCRRLCNVVDRFGVPSEYLNPNAIRVFTTRFMAETDPVKPVSLATYLHHVEQARTTDDGWFGIKVQPQQILSLVGNRVEDAYRFVAGFDQVVLLTRRDKLGQAVSGAIAQMTGSWFSNGEEPKLDDARIALLFPMVGRNLARYIEEERFILNVGMALAKPLLRIEYEGILQDSQASFLNMVKFLAGDEPAPLAEVESTPVPEKGQGTFAQKVREGFSEFIAGTRPGVYVPQPAKAQQI